MCVVDSTEEMRNVKIGTIRTNSLSFVSKTPDGVHGFRRFYIGGFYSFPRTSNRNVIKVVG